jgi:hypothetical protein
MLGRILMVGAAAAALGACSVETRTVVAADDACSVYGFRVGSVEYSRCQSREAAARRAGRMRAGYSQAQFVADSQAACSSYGLAPYTDRYERCVRNEYAYRQPG